MRAWVIHEHGGPDVFQPIELPTPQPGPGQVRIRVAATSVNPVDYKIRSGAVPIPPAFPAILHGDVAGTIDALGPGVATFNPGDRVYGCVGGLKGTQGVLADYALADADLIALAPKSIPLEDAAALPLVTITAWEGLDKADVNQGTNILVHGGTGGVGHVVVQLAKARGAKVSATVGSADKAQLARSLGADEIIHYKNEKVEQYVARLTGGRGFDVVFDTVGGANIPPSIEAAALNGHVVCIAGRAQIDGGSLHMKGLSFHLVFMLIPLLFGVERARHGGILRQAAAMVDQGKLKPLIDEKRFTFDQIAGAHAYAEAGGHVGKIVVTHGS